MTEYIWNNYRDKIYHYLNSKLGDSEQAKDLTQEIFVKILDKEQELQEIGNFDNWIYRVAKNKLIDYTRKKKELRLNEDENIYRETNGDDMAVLVDSINACLADIIEEYDEVESTLLLEIFSGEISQKEAAQQLGIPYSTLKSRVQKARNIIFKRFVDECCKLVYNKAGDIINCEPVTARAKEKC